MRCSRKSRIVVEGWRAKMRSLLSRHYAYNTCLALDHKNFRGNTLTLVQSVDFLPIAHLRTDLKLSPEIGSRTSQFGIFRLTSNSFLSQTIIRNRNEDSEKLAQRCKS